MATLLLQAREEILEAALRLFAHRDVESVSMQELAKESGASAALVHHYFGDKHRLAPPPSSGPRTSWST